MFKKRKKLLLAFIILIIVVLLFTVLITWIATYIQQQNANEAIQQAAIQELIDQNAQAATWWTVSITTWSGNILTGELIPTSWE